jgi:hypothetical protein
MKCEDLTGRVFTRLTVISFSHEYVSPCGKRKFYWNCKCQCGKEKGVQGACLRVGFTQSCGCLSKEINLVKNTIHGMSANGKRHPMWQAWQNIRARCGNPKATGYKWYGGRGIRVCERWQTFQNFVEDMLHTWQKGLSIDRINNNGDYEPGNCRWVTWDVQVKNKRKRGTA